MADADFEYLPQTVPVMDPLIEQLSPPKDLSHHFSRVTKLRAESKIKEFYKFFLIPGVGNLAGGLPNASLFPYDTLEASVALPDRHKPTPNDNSGLDSISEDFSATSISKSSETNSSHLVVPHDSTSLDPTQKIDLATALQYGQASGIAPLAAFLRQFTKENLHPNVPYLNGPEIQMTCGSTDGYSKVLECFSNVWSEERDWIREREGLLCEEFSYMNAIQGAKPRGLQIVTVKMDDEGMLPYGPGSLEDILSNWDDRKGKRPHLMYLVTIGQNPTSGVQPVSRRKEIYALCSKYDVLIIEDEPYWYIQFPSSADHPPHNVQFQPDRPAYTLPKGAKTSGFEYLDSLVPSYLSMDTDGRVIRLDTFSKTVAPGCRLGWITAQPAIIERLLRITESTTSQPSGFVQAMIAELIMGPQSKATSAGRGGAKNGQGWKVDGWVRWLEGLRGVYERRMNRMSTILDGGKYSLKQSTPIKKEEEEWAVVSKTQIFDFSWPRAGMFLWMKILFENHPLWGVKGAEPDILSRALWIHLTTKPFMVLLAPGAMFSPTPQVLEEKGWKYFRLCFAAVSEDDVDSCSDRVVAGIQSFWKIKKVEDLDELVNSAEVRAGRAEGMVDLGGMQFC